MKEQQQRREAVNQPTNYVAQPVVKDSLTTQTDVLKRIAEYPFSRAEELSVEQMREIAREALANHIEDNLTMVQTPDQASCYCPNCEALSLELSALKAQQSNEQVEPVVFGAVTVRRLSQRFENHHDQYQFYPAGQSPYLDNADECYTVYTTPPQRKPLTSETCKWQQPDDMHMPDTWEASCGAMWTFTEGGPKDNDMHYCPKCGKPAIEKAAHGIKGQP